MENLLEFLYFMDCFPRRVFEDGFFNNQVLEVISLESVDDLLLNLFQSVYEVAVTTPSQSAVLYQRSAHS